MDLAAVVVYEILYTIAFLALISAGLAVVFGMMRVVNLAHGEFVPSLSSIQSSPVCLTPHAIPLTSSLEVETVTAWSRSASRISHFS